MSVQHFFIFKYSKQIIKNLFFVENRIIMNRWKMIRSNTTNNVMYEHKKSSNALEYFPKEWPHYYACQQKNNNVCCTRNVYVDDLNRTSLLSYHPWNRTSCAFRVYVCVSRWQRILLIVHACNNLVDRSRRSLRNVLRWVFCWIRSIVLNNCVWGEYYSRTLKLNTRMLMVLLWWRRPANRTPNTHTHTHLLTGMNMQLD